MGVSVGPPGVGVGIITPPQTPLSLQPPEQQFSSATQLPPLGTQVVVGVGVDHPGVGVGVFGAEVGVGVILSQLVTFSRCLQ